MTLRQIFQLQASLEKGRIADFEAQAGLHDKKLSDTIKPVKIDKKDQDLYKRKEDELMDKLRKRHREATNDGK